MSDDFSSIGRVVYSVMTEPENAIQTGWIVGAEMPAKLVLLLRDHVSLERGHAGLPEGAILNIAMTSQVLVELYSALRDLAQSRDIPLPK